jgi:hypothetical protein
MSPRKVLICLLFLSVLIVALAGCGGGDETTAISKTVFIRRGDAICKRGESEKRVKIEAFLQKAGVGPASPLSSKQNEEFVTKAILPPIKRIGEELKELGTPDEKADKVVEHLMAVVGELEEHPSKLTTNGGSDPFEKVAKQAGSYGFKTCILYY